MLGGWHALCFRSEDFQLLVTWWPGASLERCQFQSSFRIGNKQYWNLPAWQVSEYERIQNTIYWAIWVPKPYRQRVGMFFSALSFSMHLRCVFLLAQWNQQRNEQLRSKVIFDFDSDRWFQGIPWGCLKWIPPLNPKKTFVVSIPSHGQTFGRIGVQFLLFCSRGSMPIFLVLAASLLEQWPQNPAKSFPSFPRHRVV